jgi:hypothetical protein
MTTFHTFRAALLSGAVTLAPNVGTWFAAQAGSSKLTRCVTFEAWDQLMNGAWRPNVSSATRLRSAHPIACDTPTRGRCVKALIGRAIIHQAKDSGTTNHKSAPRASSMRSSAPLLSRLASRDESRDLWLIYRDSSKLGRSDQCNRLPPQIMTRFRRHPCWHRS